MPVAQFLVDVSAWARYVYPQAAARLDELGQAGVLATCSLVELHLLGGAQDAATYRTVARLRRQAFPMLDTDEVDLRRALEVQAVLVDAGQFTVPSAVLLVAAVAERHSVAVLHGNRCFTLVARTTGQAVEWIAPS
jgi:predicted nucleic acid-binding protein